MSCPHWTYTSYPYPRYSLADFAAGRVWTGKVTDDNIIIVRVCNHCGKEL